MANEEHLAILRKGVAAWNEWRDRQRFLAPDLSAASLGGMMLRDADLTLSNLTMANLSGADLRGSLLSGADLSFANLTNADLSKSALSFAKLLRTNLDGVNLTEAVCGDTLFHQCLGTGTAKGLDKLEHRGPSNIDTESLREGIHKFPDAFLRGIGLANDEIATFRALWARSPIRFFSCFISYARTDAAFAERLHNDLEAANVPCWMDVYDMRGGDYWRDQIDQAIKVHDKLILVCSGRSAVRDNVIAEVEQAIKLQDETGQKKLFPIRLDDVLFSEEVAAQSRRRLAEGKCDFDWVKRIRAFHVPDFREWEHHSAYQREFGKLLEALRQPGPQHLHEP